VHSIVINILVLFAVLTETTISVADTKTFGQATSTLVIRFARPHSLLYRQQ